MDIKNLVTEDDTEELDAEISALRDAISERNLFSNSETEELEALIAKSMVLGELYERKQWQEAKAQTVPEGFVLVPRELSENHVRSFWENKSVGVYFKDPNEINGFYKAMIEAAEKEIGEEQEQSHE